MLGSHGVVLSDNLKEKYGRYRRGRATYNGSTVRTDFKLLVGWERRPVPFNLSWSFLQPPQVDGVRGRNRMRTGNETSPGCTFRMESNA